MKSIEGRWRRVSDDEDEETDEELEQITNDDFEEETKVKKKSLNLLKGWFDWTKRKESCLNYKFKKFFILRKYHPIQK